MVRDFAYLLMWAFVSSSASLSGGYCKEYAKGKRPVGVMLDDTWFLRLILSDLLHNCLDLNGGIELHLTLSMKWA